MIGPEEIAMAYRPATQPWLVTKVFVNGPNLADNAAWRSAADADPAFGYPVPDGSGQLRSIPWNTGINQVSLRFSVDAASVLDQADLTVRGSGGTIATTGFTYDRATNTGTWTLGTIVTSDKLRLVLETPASVAR